MLARIISCAVFGLEGYPVEVEIDLSQGLPCFSIVGLPDTAVKESRDRVRAAIKNSGYDFPVKKIIINLSPADIKKAGASFDLPIAAGILAASGRIPKNVLSDTMIVGELSLDGRIKEIKGALTYALLAKSMNISRIILPSANTREAALVPEVEIYGSNRLSEVVEFLSGNLSLQPVETHETVFDNSTAYELDYSDVKGQEHAKRALEISAAGGHNVLMTGPPGSGKTMLAKRIPSILPPMSMEDALETSRIHSVIGMLPPDKPLITRRTFRAPHHTISDAGLIGGGTIPTPGEVTLAHNGVLFLDEFAEFSRKVLEVLRQPLEDGYVTISRVAGSMTFPARFILVSAMNPCPCGYFTDPKRECTCTLFQIERYKAKVSGPLMDRIDLHVDMPPVLFNDLTGKEKGETSAEVRKRVMATRKIQAERYKAETIDYNAQLHSGHIKKYCKITDSSMKLLQTSMKKLGLSARAFNKILSVGRTIADMSSNETILPEHITEAIQYRNMDRKV